MSKPRPTDPTNAAYVGNSSMMVYHLADCPLCALAIRSNLVRFDTAIDAVNQGYAACRNCLQDMDSVGQVLSRETGFTVSRLGLRRTMGVLAVLFSIAALTVTFFAGETVSKAKNQGASEGEIQGYKDGHQEGEEAATAAGYEVGYREGNDVGYADGWVRGSEEGVEKGYAEGYLEGHGDGIEEGYPLGRTSGQKAGERDGRAIGAEDGYKDGYADGFEEGVGDDYLVRNPTYSEVLEMLEGSDADTAEQMIAEFEEQGIRTGFAWLSMAEEGVARYRWVAFDTVDNGVIFVEPWSRKEIVPEIGTRISELLGYSAPDFDDTLTRVRIAW